MLTDGRTDGDGGRKVITIAHPEQSSGELISDLPEIQTPSMRLPVGQSRKFHLKLLSGIPQ